MDDGQLTKTARALQIDRSHSVWRLVVHAGRVWLTKPSVFLITALVVVVPFELIVVGAIGGGFSRSDGTASRGVDLVDSFAINTVLTALITAIHCRAVAVLADGRRITTRDALRLGSEAFWPVLGAAILYGVLTAIGFLLIILPGIYFTVAALFAPQTAALTKTGPSDSISASLTLVSSVGWWRAFGSWIVLVLSGSLVITAGAVGVAAVADAAGNSGVVGPLMVLLTAVLEAAVLSWTALASTLLYFSFRARAGEPFGGAQESARFEQEHAGADWTPTV